MGIFHHDINWIYIDFMNLTYITWSSIIPFIVCRKKWHLIYESGCTCVMIYGANMGPTRVLSASDGPHVGPMNLAIREAIRERCCTRVAAYHLVPFGLCYSPFLHATRTTLCCSAHWGRRPVSQMALDYWRSTEELATKNASSGIGANNG